MCDQYSWEDALQLRSLIAKSPALSEFTNVRVNEIYIKDVENGRIRRVSSNFNERANLFTNSITGLCTCNNLLSEV